MTLTALRWFFPSNHTGNTGRVTGLLDGHAEKDLKQDTKVVLRVLVHGGVQHSVCQVGPLTLGLPSSLKS